MTKSSFRQAGFTLIELLVVIGIIAMLATVLLVTVGSAQQAATEFNCQANLRNIGASIQAYKVRHQGNLPPGGGRKLLWSVWRELEHSDNNRRMFFCPEVLPAFAADWLAEPAEEWWKEEEDLPREQMTYAAIKAKFKADMHKASQAVIADANDGRMNHQSGTTVVLYGDLSTKMLVKTDLQDQGIWPKDDPDFVLTVGEGSPHKDLEKLTID
ncbi:MAG: type II secretion system protein [Planctomycetes bacterium]|nr:type II secretion system protein [Planctomycetota bacterium]